MITNFKIFESKNKLPQIGDYILCDDGKDDYGDELFKFLKNNIGQYIVNLKNLHDDPRYDRWLNDCDYLIEYKNVPKKFNTNRYMVNNCRAMHISQVNKYWSKNKEDLELILKAKKYNL